MKPASFFTPPESPDPTALLAGLSDDASARQGLRPVGCGRVTVTRF